MASLYWEIYYLDESNNHHIKLFLFIRNSVFRVYKRRYTCHQYKSQILWPNFIQKSKYFASILWHLIQVVFLQLMPSLYQSRVLKPQFKPIKALNALRKHDFLLSWHEHFFNFFFSWFSFFLRQNATKTLFFPYSAIIYSIVAVLSIHYTLTHTVDR